MKIRVILFLIIGQFFLSCDVYHDIIGTEKKISRGYYMIGAIIEGKENRSFPIYSKKIKINWKEHKLTKENIKLINSDLHEENKLVISDSLNSYPESIKLEIADYTMLVTNLKQKTNQPIIDALKNNPKLKMLTDLNVYFDKVQTQLIKNASVLYLVNPRQGYYTIEALSSEGKKQYIPIEQGLVLDIETKGFCWQLDNRNQPELVNISDNCHSGSERKIKNLKIIDKTKGLW